ncbi:UDP-N-acetylmuramate dehydrogenase [Wohlfahrtiimonas larvae]|uniref:UDP-N-acetylenolpyruvoylglucosamine reductase n=1 Tax=Wohlfahrtiimonas larvae TaxID=1157986 RepID=A0ABP9MKI3_9GAMM|nr:UDP-N-acetylmuramate dehydrogenase [Wohlfahrtiimonas larvae]
MIKQNFNLTSLNTFGVSVFADYYCCLESESQLTTLRSLVAPIFYLGGGSNILLTKNYHGTVLHNCIKGIEILEEDESSVLVRAYAGEVWHDFVTETINAGWFGLECLAYIPGTVGATPVQNIGAYGVEAKDYIEKVCVYDFKTGNFEYYQNEECHFAYRHSIFKTELQDRLIISVDFRLSKKAIVYHRFYPALQEYLAEHGIAQPTPKDIYQAVISVRQSKLPEVTEIGSAGSFFKNPVITTQHFSELSIRFPQLSSYFYDEDHVKVPAGQLIDILGFKGKYESNVGMYEKQALILVNLGGATGEALHQHSIKVMNAVYEKFKICLEPEVIIL